MSSDKTDAVAVVARIRKALVAHIKAGHTLAKEMQQWRNDLCDVEEALMHSAERPTGMPRHALHMPAELHPDTRFLVKRFAEALALKLHAAEKKYGYSDGWAGNDWMEECQARLLEHVAKGDPRDVAAYCAFMWHHGWPTKASTSSATRKETP